MSFGSGTDSFKVKTFETQEEVNEKKRKRQEEWDKVRKPDDPEGQYAPRDVPLAFTYYMLP